MTFSLTPQNDSGELQYLELQKREVERNIQDTQVRIRIIENQIQSAVASPSVIKRDLKQSLQEVGADVEDIIGYLTQVKEVFAKLSARLHDNELNIKGEDDSRRIASSIELILEVVTNEQSRNDRINSLSTELNELTSQLRLDEARLQDKVNQIEELVRKGSVLGYTNKELIAQVEAIPFVVPGSVSIPPSEEYLQFSMTPLKAYPVGTFSDSGVSLSIPETTIRIPGSAVGKTVIHASDPCVPRPYKYADPSIHPHVIGTDPCFGDFGPAIAELRVANDIISLIYLIRQYMSVFDPIDDAGRYWAHGILAEHAPQVWESGSRVRAIGAFVPRNSAGSFTTFVVGFNPDRLPPGVNNNYISINVTPESGEKLVCSAGQPDLGLVEWMNENAVALIFKDGVWERTSFVAP